MEGFLGTIYETISTIKLRFSTKPGGSVSSGQLVEIIGDNKSKTHYLGRVTGIERKNYLIDQDGAVQLSTLYEDNEKLNSEDIGIKGDFQDYVICEVEIIGNRKSNGTIFNRPRKPFKIGTKVYKASSDFLNDQLKPWGNSIEIGKFRDNKKVPIHIDLNELISKHFSVLAMTGSGKSWTVSVIIEAIANNFDIPILIFDPHGEYSSLKIPSNKNINQNTISDKVKVYMPSDITSKERSDDMFKEKFGIDRESELLHVNITELETYQIIHLLRSLYDLSEAQSRILQAGWTDIIEDPELRNTINIEKIIKKLGDIGSDVVQGPSAKNILSTKLRILFNSMPFIRKSTSDTPLELNNLVKKGQISVIDMSGIEVIHQQALMAILSSKILKSRMEGRIPPLLMILEEAHRYIPSGAVSTASKPTIKRVAQEGRKFLMGMGIVSQRPSRLDDDVLSQCNNQVIMRLTNPNDQNYVKKVSEWVADRDLEEIRSMVPGEAFIFGSAVPLSLPIKVTKDRLTKHGGYTPDIIDEIEKY
ncbi:ATP-binding protein [Methanobacterium alcaliphilum]|uniref:ATP-binding protein n=1 Tax=Methanobacterium alcaliphilum TaxID=392018 RepID=UPI00200A4DA7|nr:ATP-binding protein [Methanobacterium alcaliphilum]MCK9151806.1 ATP-binding protein [Methanobacterium alcaliphilum]